MEYQHDIDDWMCYNVGRMAQVDNKGFTTMQSL
jgi:hypothetical protein